ncbi:hemerythrin domain-containing protein [Candidatus Paracaedibacter symbiosus]|uniref:hemerythrin domain-containing protein n=1 Tax=Candidatus Paracaedibacter symbiosus TaxID=244582 RepID=UPI0006895BA6|nr:hemerythrin domain-containing protein [Candidatus Paracaedibacter symbiosus]
MTIYDLLIVDHNKVKQLYREMLIHSGKEQEDLFNQIKTEVLLHAHAEEEIFYKHLQKRDSLDSQIEHSYSEHQEVENQLEEITSKISSGEEWLGIAKEMMQNLSHHIEEEENKLFPEARKIIDKNEEKELGDQFRLQKNKLADKG